MAAPENFPALEIRHKSQQSHDSGTYIDWNSEDSTSPVLGNGASNVTGEFVTVVAVESGGPDGNYADALENIELEKNGNNTPFVTVLSIGDEPVVPKETKVSVNVSVTGEQLEEKDRNDQEKEILQDDIVEDVLVYRLPGERLGFGLKFEGGTKTSECVRRLFIQSCAPDSPASRAQCSWGLLQEGDEVLQIDDVPVNVMTRIDCVRCLKESNVVIKLLIRHSLIPWTFDDGNGLINNGIADYGNIERNGLVNNGNADYGNIERSSKSNQNLPLVIGAAVKKTASPPPPPIPPRKMSKKLSSVNKDNESGSSNSCKPPLPPITAESQSLSTLPMSKTSPNEEFGFEDIRTQKSHQRLPPSPKSPLKLNISSCPESPRNASKRFSNFDTVSIPPEAEIYMDLLAQEEFNRLNRESESDDTGSSISTIVDKLSSVPTTSNSSFSDLRSSCDTTTPSTPTAVTMPAIDLAKVLSPFEQLEREFADNSNGFIFDKFVRSEDDFENSSPPQLIEECINEVDGIALQPPVSFQDSPVDTNNDVQDISQDGLLHDKNDTYTNTNVIYEPIQQTKNTELLSIEQKSEVPTAADENLTIQIHNDSTGLPPVPSPRKEIATNGPKFKSGKKRPPPPPPPRNDRPQAPNPVIVVEEASNIATEDIDCIVNAEHNKQTLPEIQVETVTSDISTGNIGSEVDNINFPEQEIQCSSPVVSHSPTNECQDIDESTEEVQLLGDVVEVIEILPLDNQDDDENNSIKDFEELEARILEEEDDDDEDFLPPEFKNGALLSPSEAFFPLRWGMTSHLATIGEDEDENEGYEGEDAGQSAATEFASTLLPSVIEEESPLEGDDESDTSAVVREFEKIETLAQAEDITVTTGAEDSARPVTEQGQKMGDENASDMRRKEEETMSDQEQQENMKTEEVSGVELQPEEQTTQDISRKTAVKSLSNSFSEDDEKVAIKTSSIADDDLISTTDSKADVNVVKQDSPDCQSVRGTMEALLALDTLTAPHRAPPFVAPVDSPTLSPPPSFSRLPPDGHEFPPNYHEPSFNVGVPVIIEMSLDQNPVEELLKPIQNMTPPSSSSPPPLPASVPPMRKHSEDLPNGRKTSVEERRTQIWHKDEKSEKSVRDKIAMFSSVKDEPLSPAQVPKKINKHGSSDDILNHTEDCSPNKMMSRSVLSIDRTGKGNSSPSTGNDLNRKIPTIFNSMNDVSTSITDSSEPSRTLDFTSRAQSNLDLTSSSSAYSSSGSPDSSLSSMTSSYSYSSTLPRKLSNGYQTPNKVSDSIVQNGTTSNLGRTSNINVGNNLHTRSQSMVDIGSEPYSGRRSSLNQLKSNNDGNTTLSAMMEQRRRGISKLRGLVIPEKVSEVSSTQPIIDLPEIKSRDSILVSKPPQVTNKDTSYSSRPSRWSVDHTANNEKIVVNNATPSLSSPPWKTHSTLPNLPKYSPAFKRKSLTLYGVPSSASSLSSSRSSSKEELRPLFDSPSTVKNTPPLPPSKPPRNSLQTYNSPFLQQQEPPKSLESIVSPTRSDMSFEYISSNRSSPDYRTNEVSKNKILNGDHYIRSSRLSPKSKNDLSPDFGRPGEDDSDNDSAVSSSRSSISHGFSPPLSPVPDTNGRTLPDDHNHSHHSILSSLPSSNGSSDKRPLRRTLSSETTASAASSTASTLTSGSQASCSSNGSSSGSDTNKRVLKAQSVEAINRKNVLSSARYSSGKDIKIGSPLIQRKFEEDVIDYSNADKIETIDDDNNKNATFRYSPKLNTGVNSTKKSNDLVHYKPSESDDLSIEPNIIYYEVQETDTPCIVLDESNLETNNEKLASINGIEIVEVENSESLVAKSLPQPAPRRTGIPTPIKPPNGKETNSSSTVNDDKWLELQKKYSVANTNDNTSTTVSKILPQFEKNSDSKQESESGKVFDTKEFTLDLKTKTLSVANESENLKTFRRFSSSDNSENTNSRKSSITSVTELSFTHKPDERNNIDGLRNNYSENVSASKEDDLLNILNNRISKDTSATAQGRERRRSKDLESSKLTSFLNSERVSSCDDSLSQKVLKLNDSDVTLNTKIPVTRSNNNRRSVSVNDIRKAFEKAEIAVTNGSRLTNGKSSTSSVMNGNGLFNHHVRVSSLDSTTSEDSFIPPPSLQKEQFGSVTSIASSTSLISQQELQTLIDEANQVLEETGSCSPPVYEVNVIVLHRETPGGSIGITLAGGADYETKEITVHKVLTGSPADRDGRIQKGDRILSINGRSMKGVTHRESLNILKAPRSEVVLVVSKSRPDYDNSLPTEDILMSAVRTSLGRQLRIPEQLPEELLLSQDKDTEVPRGPPIKVALTKDGAGLGFSLEGGKDSPMGDRPLVIKKIFTGGAAEKNGLLVAGDEVINVNGSDVTSMSRIEAWSLMKKLPDGNVTLTVRHKAAS